MVDQPSEGARQLRAGPWAAAGVAALAALLVAGCADSPRTAIRLIVNMPEGTQVDQLHVVATVEGGPLLTTALPQQAAGALASTTDLVLWVSDAVAGKSVEFVVEGTYASALVAHGNTGLVPKLGKTLRLTLQLEAASPCPVGQLNCAGTCTDPATDRDHCGRCDVACDPSQICRGAACIHNPCGDGQHECSGACYPDDDYLHCGPACVACAVPAAHGVARCEQDQCELDCDAGFVVCPGACVDLNTDRLNCGSCGHECGADQACRSSNCTSTACPGGSHDCPGLGCVSNADVAHCGTACTPCVPPASATATCDGVSCGFACQTGTHRCGDACLSNYSAASCGTRCTACPAVNGTATCDGTNCGLVCNGGYHACGGLCVSNTATATCGTSCTPCAVPLNGSATCDGVTCGVECNNGFKACGTACIANSATCVTWRQLTTLSTRPSPRAFAGMAYDSQRHVVVLFGGWDGADLDDTWEFDGTSWSLKSPANRPSARDSVAMAYDPLRNRVVLFGGYGNVAEGDTWVWDGTNWESPVSVTTPPPARYGAAATWDGLGSVVMFGGQDTELVPTTYNDVWRWNGTDWSQHTPAGTPPSARVAAGFVREDLQVVVFGGSDGWNLVNTYGDMFALTIAGWSPLTATGPSARGAMGFAHDLQHGTSILFGGLTGPNFAVGGTWRWNAGAWTKLTPALEPGARGGVAMAYDAQRQVMVLFGGTTGATYLDETWEFVQ